MAIHPTIAPESEDLVIHKPETDAFYGTTLQQELDARDLDHLIVVGCKSEACVDATCRKAIDLGYQVTLVSDAHSTTDNTVLTAPQIVAYHNYILQMVWSDEHGKIVEISVKPTSDIVMVSS